MTKTDSSRRRFLTTTTAAVGALGSAYLAVPFIKSWLPSAASRAAGAPVTVNFSKLESGQVLKVTWRGQPVWVIRRSQEMLDTLHDDGLLRRLRDPYSEVKAQQPEYARNEHRSIREDIFVIVAICTHLGCVPSYRPLPGSGQLGSDWPGGFYCPCHNSRFDLAGRVFTGVPAPVNLIVPPHAFLDSNTVQIGDDVA